MRIEIQSGDNAIGSMPFLWNLYQETQQVLLHVELCRDYNTLRECKKELALQGSIYPAVYGKPIDISQRCFSTNTMANHSDEFANSDIKSTQNLKGAMLVNFL